MNINEVSWVDNPANEVPFLFVKNADAGENEELEKMDKDTNLDLAISVKEGELSSLSINGAAITGEVVNVSLWYTSDENLHCSYSTQESESEDGFNAVQSYSMYKGKVEAGQEYKTATPATDEELAKVRKLADVPNTADGQIVRELGEYAETIAIYADELPADLRKAISETIRLACNTQEVDANTEDKPMQKEADKPNEGTADTTATTAPQEGIVTQVAAATQTPEQLAASQPVAPTVVLTQENLDAIANQVTAQLAAKQAADKAAEDMVEMSGEEVAAMMAAEAVAAVSGDETTTATE